MTVNYYAIIDSSDKVLYNVGEPLTHSDGSTELDYCYYNKNSAILKCKDILTNYVHNTESCNRSFHDKDLKNNNIIRDNNTKFDFKIKSFVFDVIENKKNDDFTEVKCKKLYLARAYEIKNITKTIIGEDGLQYSRNDSEKEYISNWFDITTNFTDPSTSLYVIKKTILIYD